MQSLDRLLDAAFNRVAAAKQALYGAAKKSEALISRARDIERDLDEIAVVLRGDKTVSKRFEPTTPSLRQRIGRASSGFFFLLPMHGKTNGRKWSILQIK